MSKNGSSNERKAALRRSSRETEVIVSLDLDPERPAASIDTGIGFLDHMLGSLALHSGWSLSLACRGDLVVDEHHSAEDCAIALGEALARAVARGVAAGMAPRRFGSACAPMDEALARAVIDFSGRPFCRTDLRLDGARMGGLAGENVAHFLSSLASSARMTLHVDLLAGENSHHKAEAAFKALALAFREALAPTAGLAAGGSGGAAAGGAAARPGEAAGASAKGSVALEEIVEGDFERIRADMERKRDAERRG
jgi:imidazoleglycerol-phosphate dehydratase